PARRHLPAGLDELLIGDGEYVRVVIVDERARFSGGLRQRSEFRIDDGRAARLVEGAADAIDGQVARLGSEADTTAVGPVEHGLDAEPVHLGRLGLLDAVARDV